MNTPIKNSLARLPYQEMLQLSREIADRLPDIATAEDVARVLSSLEFNTDIERRDNTLLSLSFTRKKVMTIQPHLNGYKVAIPTIEGGVVIGSDIRACVSQLFDHVTVVNAMES